MLSAIKQMIKSRKGVELGLNTIVIAVIVLIVLVVTIVILSGRLSLFSEGIRDCDANHGVCITEQQCSDFGGRSDDKSNCASNQVCCMNGCSTLGGTPTSSGQCAQSQQKLPVIMKGDWVCCK